MLRVGQNVTLDGSVQIVLQPELFDQFHFSPERGQSFDLVTAEGGITLAPGLQVRDLVTSAGQQRPPLNQLALTAYSSGIAADPDSLLLIGTDVFSVTLANAGKVLRATYIGPVANPPFPAPLPGWTSSLLLALLLSGGMFASRHRSRVSGVAASS